MFQQLYGRPPAITAAAPGRVNLIGEHTDYNGGFVLPTVIPQQTRVALAPRNDRRVRVASVNMNEPPVIEEYALGQESAGRGWLDYVQGITHVLGKQGLTLGGFDAWIESDVPVGSGLSSSAALEISLLRALRQVFGLALDDVEIALVGQRAENEFVGARCGIMDQMASSLAGPGVALFLDARNLRYERVSIPSEADLVVLNSGVAHDHAAGDYNTRRAECEQACALLGVEQLRDLGAADLPRVDQLPMPLSRRARHVITENDRVQAAVKALRTKDLARLGELFYQSHDSMRNDYAVSIQAIDLIVDLARAEEDVYGARLTGGGFGGSVVMLGRSGTGRAVAERIARQYARQSGQTPTVMVPA